MKKPIWMALFAESEPQATVALLPDLNRFIERADNISKQIEAYCWDHTQKTIRGSARVVILTEAMRLNGCLILLKTKALRGDRITPHCDELVDQWEAFQAENWLYLNPLQSPSKRRAIRNLHAASRAPRPGARKLPGLEQLQAEFNKIAETSGKSGAAAILAKNYKVTAAAVRKALRKNKKET